MKLGVQVQLDTRMMTIYSYDSFFIDLLLIHMDIKCQFNVWLHAENQ